jgi:hypothetical protein
MLALITQSVLDVGFGIIWWTAKKTGTALSYGIDYFWYDGEANQKLENQVINMEDFKEILLENNKKIVELTNKIEALENLN